MRGPAKETHQHGQIQTSEARTRKSRTRLESEPPPQQVQRPDQLSIGGHPRETM